ncbi:hypothetical protein AB8880_10075 [Alphaproteobacteria bacterium LSUCC0684]
MTQKLNTASVAYTKLQNGHGFQAADKKAGWLLVTSHDLNDAIEEVSQQLSEILGGKWYPTEETKSYLFKGADTKDINIVGTPYSGFAGVMSWTSDAA